MNYPDNDEGDKKLNSTEVCEVQTESQNVEVFEIESRNGKIQSDDQQDILDQPYQDSVVCDYDKMPTVIKDGLP